MKFWEAIKALQDGKKIKRDPFSEGCYVSLAEGIVGCTILNTDFLYCCQFEWEIYEEPLKQYNFLEALDLMKQGKKARRISHPKHLSFSLIGADRQIISHYLFTEDYEAKDWVEVKE